MSRRHVVRRRHLRAGGGAVVVLGWNVTATALLIAMPAVVYTMFGGVQAVTWTDVKQMVLIVVGPVRRDRRLLVLGLPDGVGIHRRRCGIAGATGRLQTFDFTFDLTNQYTFWSGTIAALFLFCSYFGTDQSQVQRYLTARSVDEARAVAADERLLEDSAAGARAAARRVRVRVLRVHAAAAAVQPRARGAAASRARRPRSTRRSRREFDAAFEARTRRRARRSPRRAQRRRARGSPRRAGVPRAGGRRCRPSAPRRMALVRGTPAIGAFTDVNYIIPTFILTHCRSVSSACSSPPSYGGDRHDCRRTEFALDRDGHRLLPAVASGRRPPTRTT